MSTIHPLLATLPVGLLLASLLMEVLGLPFRKMFLSRVGLVLLALGLGLMVLALATGPYAAEAANPSKAASEVLDSHRLSAWIAFGFFLFLFLVRALLELTGRLRGLIGWTYVLLLAVSSVVLCFAFWTGKRLVFDFGLGVLVKG